MYRPASFSQLPEVVKNLLIINILFFVATISLESYGINLVKWFGLHQFQSPDFMPHQLITHFFMHANFTHLLFNMLIGSQSIYCICCIYHIFSILDIFYSVRIT